MLLVVVFERVDPKAGGNANSTSPLIRLECNSYVEILARETLVCYHRGNGGMRGVGFQPYIFDLCSDYLKLHAFLGVLH
jgi:hypothetical protein